MIYIFLFVIGTVLGSFLNVCIYRLPRHESIVVPPSHCPSCSASIRWYDNIPVISFIILGGKCRACKARISFRYVVVELLTGVILVALAMRFGVGEQLLAYTVLAAALIVATFIDIAIQEIPDEISLGGIAVGVVIALVFPAVFGTSSRLWSLGQSVAGIVVGGLIIYLMGLFGELIFKKEAMGGGDVKLMAMIGAFVGWKLVLIAFFLAPFFGSVAGIIAKVKYHHETIPYGPHLALGAFVALMWGDALIRALVYGTM